MRCITDKIGILALDISLGGMVVRSLIDCGVDIYLPAAIRLWLMRKNCVVLQVFLTIDIFNTIGSTFKNIDFFQCNCAKGPQIIQMR